MGVQPRVAVLQLAFLPVLFLLVLFTAYDWPDNVTQHKEFIEVDKENGLNVLILLVFREQER